MLRQRTRTLQATMALVDALTTCGAFFIAYYAAGPLMERVANLKVVLSIDRYYWVPGVSVPMWWGLFTLFGSYDLSPIERTRDGLLRLWRPLLAGALAIGALSFFHKDPDFSRRVLASISLVNVVAILVGRGIVLAVVARTMRQRGGMRRILVVGAGQAAQEFAETVRRAGWGLEMAGFVGPESDNALPNHLGPVSDLPGIIDAQTIDDVVIATGRDLAEVQEIIHACEEVGVSVHIPSSFFKADLSRPHLEPFFGTPMLTFSSAPHSPLALAVKRAFDIIFGLMLLLAALIPGMVIAVIIKCTSRGPVIFSQKRAGLYGRVFVMHKFRSMVAEAEARKAELATMNQADGPAFKIQDDPRVTPFGRWLRRYSFDELPQLWNVLKGDMSLVGPRPPLPKEIAHYERWQRRRLSMRPGLTCIWQVTDRTHDSFDKWMEYDLEYIDKWSLWLDLTIALRTIPAVLQATGT